MAKKPFCFTALICKQGMNENGQTHLNILMALLSVMNETYESIIPCQVYCARTFSMDGRDLVSASQPNVIAGGKGAFSLYRMIPHVFVLPLNKE